MANITECLLERERETGETIEAIVVGKHYRDSWLEDRRPEHMRDKMLTRNDGLALLNVEHDDGFGGADCYPMYAWSKSRVYFISEYDGSTRLSCLPRHPVDCEPCFDGNL